MLDGQLRPTIPHGSPPPATYAHNKQKPNAARLISRPMHADAAPPAGMHYAMASWARKPVVDTVINMPLSVLSKDQQAECKWTGQF